MVGHKEIFRKECGGSNRSSTLDTLEWGCSHKLGRELLRNVMVMMMAVNVSIMGHEHHGDRYVLMVVMVRLESLDSAQGRASAVALFISSGLIILSRLSALSSRRSTAACFGFIVHFLRHMLEILAPSHHPALEGQLGPGGNGTGDS